MSFFFFFSLSLRAVVEVSNQFAFLQVVEGNICYVHHTLMHI